MHNVKNISLKNLRVAIIHNTVAPYRHSLFEKLSKYTSLIVYYCSVKHVHRDWDLWPRVYHYKYKILLRIPLKFSKEELSLNPTIINEITRNRPHIIIIAGHIDPTMWIIFAIARLLKIPIIYWTGGIKEPKLILGRITRPLRMLFVKSACAIVVPGEMSRRYVIGLGANSEKVFTAPYVIDNELFIQVSCKYYPKKEELKDKLGLRNKIVILYVGQLIERKGIIYLLEAYKKLKTENKNIALVIVGHGKLYNKLLKVCREKGIDNVIFTGSIKDLNELIKYYCMADIFVLPTLEDIWGFVINEAMACSLPVVSTRTSQAAREMVIHGENGYIVREADSEALYDALKKLVYNHKLREEMGKKSRQILIQKFKVDYTVEGFIRAIKWCIDKRNGKCLHP